MTSSLTKVLKVSFYSHSDYYKLFSGYTWYTFHNKTQIKNFQYIYISKVFYLYFIVKRIPSISREKFIIKFKYVFKYNVHCNRFKLYYFIRYHLN